MGLVSGSRGRRGGWIGMSRSRGPVPIEALSMQSSSEPVAPRSQTRHRKPQRTSSDSASTITAGSSPSPSSPCSIIRNATSAV